MVAAGILTKEDHVELIQGEIVAMTAIGPRHAGIVNRLNKAFFSLEENRALIAIQNPVKLDDYNEPEPDFALLKPRLDDYTESHPGPADILLIIEVSDSSLTYDQNIKAKLYAQAGVPEFWLITLAEDAILAYRQPTAEGYRSMQKVVPGETISPQAFPDVHIAVDDILK